jgi:hypothetical protein
MSRNVERFERMPRTASLGVAIDLFSGAGGSALGFKRAGFRIAGAAEMDPDASGPTRT